MMKNYLKTTFALALVALFAFSSCSKDNNAADSNELRKVSLKLTPEMADQLESRAVGPHIDATKTVVFNTGYIYFTNAGGGITKTITIESGNAAYNGTKVGIETLTDKGIVVEGVDAGSTKVHIAGNITVTGTPTNISQVMATDVTLGSQYDDGTTVAANKGGVDKVALYGVGNITAETGTLDTKAYDFKAEVKINPINSRLEIGKLTAGGEIKSYKVEGIFINNYYIKTQFDGTAVVADLKDNGKDEAKYAPTSNGGSYATNLHLIIYDYAVDGTGEQDDATGLITYPDKTVTNGSKVWAYNFLIANPAVNPEIVIRIKDVVLKNGDATSYEGTQFISIRNFYVGSYDPAEGATNEALTMAKGNVYRIQDIKFSDADLRKTPLEDSKNVLVEAELMKWASTDIGYKLD